MSKKVAILDTNIYVIHYAGYQPIIELIDHLDEEFEIYMSTIILMELMWYEKIDSDPDIRKSRQGYIDAADYVLDVTEDIALKAAEIRREWFKTTGKKIKHGDALIAATAIINQTTLFSNNDKDFIFLRDNPKFKLKFINPIVYQLDLINFIDSLNK